MAGVTFAARQRWDWRCAATADRVHLAGIDRGALPLARSAAPGAAARRLGLSVCTTRRGPLRSAPGVGALRTGRMGATGIRRPAEFTYFAAEGSTAGT